MSITIPLAFIMMNAIVLWLIIGTKGSKVNPGAPGSSILKLMVLLMANYFAIAIWHSLDSYKGWATPDALPAEFVVIGADVIEPKKTTGDPGYVYLWIKIIDKDTDQDRILSWMGYHAGPGEPRAYALPYSRKLHEQVNQIQQMLRDGKMVKGQNGKPGEGDGIKDKDGDKDGSSGEGDMSQEQEIEFHELRPGSLPDKYKRHH